MEKKKIMKISEALNKAKTILNNKKIEDANIISRILLAKVLNISKEKLIIEYDKEISKKEEEIFFDGIEKISNGYPLQYLTSAQEFMKMKFFVNENVLIPRPDTESLVLEVIKICKDENKKDILELCTGSGIIAISLAKYLKNVKILATDISNLALEVARKNAKELLDLDEKEISFIQSDMFENVDKKYDLIVSNPPYIRKNDIEKYNLEYEPKLALDGGEDGLDFYRIIIEEGYKYLKKNGIIALEIGFDQKEDVINLANNIGKYKEIYSLKDLGGNDRVVVLKL